MHRLFYIFICNLFICTLFIIYLCHIASTTFRTRQERNDAKQFLTSISGTDTTTITILNTDSPNSISNIEFISYGKSEFDIISNQNFPLDSTLLCNSEDEILYDGYITNIKISLYDFFNVLSPTDFQLHFVTILGNNILSTWKITPTKSSLFHTFEISPWELMVKSGSFLCVATDNNDTLLMGDSYVIGNRISATHSGKAYLSSNYFSPYNHIQLQWNGENLGIALSFTVAHNPMWDVTIPTTIVSTTIITTTTIIATPNSDTNVSYGPSSDDALDEDISLNSLFLFNWDHKCLKSGYIINIKIQFCTPFRSENTVDGFLWFFTADIYGNIHQKYSVIPSNTSLIQSFSFAQRTLIIRVEQYLSVGTFSQNSNGNNTICLRRTGVAYSATTTENLNSVMIMNIKPGRSVVGIALNYVVLSNLETPSLDASGPDLG